jgi:hypothetical protein
LDICCEEAIQGVLSDFAPTGSKLCFPPSTTSHFYSPLEGMMLSHPTPKSQFGAKSDRAPTTGWHRLQAWAQDGTWERVWRALLSRLDARRKLEWTKAFLDGSFVPAKRGWGHRENESRQGQQGDGRGRRPWPAHRAAWRERPTPREPTGGNRLGNGSCPTATRSSSDTPAGAGGGQGV